MSTVIADKYYTVTEASEILGISGSRIRQLIAGGQIAAEPVHNRLWIIPAKALDKFQQQDRPTGVHLDRRNA